MYKHLFQTHLSFKQPLKPKNSLSTDPRNTVFIMSGRERKFLESWLGHLHVGLAAEYGFYHRMPGEKEWICENDAVELEWKDLVQPIMKYFTERTPGTYIESKESSLAWHYKDADPHFGAWQVAYVFYFKCVCENYIVYLIVLFIVVFKNICSFEHNFKQKHTQN